MHKIVVRKYAVRLIPVLMATVFAGGSRAEMALEEVIVTAQKRQEKLQDVPISITAISGSQLETRGIQGVADLSALAPNFVFRPSGGSGSIAILTIRGSMASNPTIWIDPPISTYVDGAYIGKAQGGMFDVLDLERVEVLRGPQGTLFGRNTAGGAVNFVTRKPSGEFGGSVGLEVGNYGRTVEKVTIDLPKMGMFSTKFGYRKEDQDGWVKNTTPGAPDFSKKDKEAFNFAARIDLSSDTKVDYKYDQSESNGTPPVFSLVNQTSALRSVAGTFGTALANAQAPYVATERPKSAGTPAGYPFYDKLHIEGHALTISHQLNSNNEIKYIYATRDMKLDDALNVGGTPLISVPATGRATIYHTQRHTRYTQDSHELQWVGHTDRLNYAAGLYWFKDDGTTHAPQMVTVYGATPTRADFNAQTDAKAWYGQLDYKVTDALTATAGMRHTTEKKSGWTHRYSTSGVLDGAPSGDLLPMTSYSTSWSANTPLLALNYKLSETTNVYARLAKGFKSGGFSGEATTVAALTIPFNPELATSSEIGIKSSLLDNRAQVGATYFRNKVTDLQVSHVVGSTISVIDNAGKATYQGIELEGTFLLAEGWRLQTNYGYLDAKLTEYIDNALNIPGNPLIDTASNRVAPYAPKHTFNLNLDGRLAKTAWGTLRGILDYSYSAKYVNKASNKSLTDPNAGGLGVVGLVGMTTMPANRNLNARLLLADIPVGGPGKMDASLWVKNLNNEKKWISMVDDGFAIHTNWAEPRTYGMSVNYKW